MKLNCLITERAKAGQKEEQGLLTHYVRPPSNLCCCWLVWWRYKRKGRSRTCQSTPCRPQSSQLEFCSSPLHSTSHTSHCRTGPDWQNHKPKIPQSDHYEKNKHRCSCLSSTWPQRKGPNSIYSERHASKGAERENRQQQQPLFLSMKPSFITRSLQAVRGALQLTVSVPKQKTQMNKLTAFCQQVRGIGKSEKQREHERERKG